MATAQTSPLVRYVRHFAARTQAAHLSDAQLLERFVCHCDEAAFAALVRRHGPLVLSACRRRLRDWHLAQDCCQVTFLVLARKAGSLRMPDALGPWLYGVALRTAAKARAEQARRRLKESRVRAAEAVEDPDDALWRDVRPVLDEAVNGLPEKYRSPFVLHYLQGVTVDEIARRLGCPRGTVATRLARAREQLRSRLVRRGVSLSAAGLAVVLSEAAAAVPAALVISTTKAAILVAAGRAVGPGVLSDRAAALAEGVLRVMHTNKIKIAVSVLVLSVLVGAGAEVFSRRSDAADTDRPRRAEARGPAKACPDDTPAKSRFRFLSLAEARAIALECGEAKESNLLFPGFFAGVGLDSMIQGPSKLRPPLVLIDLAPGAEGILVTNFPKNLGRAELERSVNQMLLNVEVAYWNLYGSYWQLYSREQGLRFAYETWKVTGAQFKVGRVGLAEFAQSQGQYEQFRSQRREALDTVLDNERQLRALLGMSAEDGVRLVPANAPTLVERHPDWQKGWAEAMKRRPELRLARQDVKIAQLNVQLAKNSLLPDLRTHAAYDTNSTGDTPKDRITGLRSVAPPGFRSAHAQLRQAQLQAGRANLVLQDQELKAERFLGMYYRRMFSAYAQIKAARAQREAFATQSRVRYDLYRVGANEPGTGGRPVTLNLLLEAQRFWADALATEYQAIVTYNNAIAGWEYAKGTILTHARVSLAEELPDGEAVRAVVYERKQTGQRVRREPKVPADSPLGWPGVRKGEDDRQPETAPSLPALWKRFPPLRGADAPLPVEPTSAREPRWTEWDVSDIFPHRQRTP